MKEKWEALLVVLHKILNIYQELLLLSQQKKQVIVAVKPQELEKITKQEEVLIMQVGKLENMRGKIVRELMTVHGMLEGDASLARLQEIASPDMREKLTVFNEKIDAVMAELVPLNKLNSELIEQALGFINYTINILSQTAVGPTYAAKGQANEQTKRTVFDAKV